MKLLWLPPKKHLFNVVSLTSFTTHVVWTVGGCTCLLLDYQTLYLLFHCHLLKLLPLVTLWDPAKCYQVKFLIIFQKLNLPIGQSISPSYGWMILGFSTMS